MIRQVRIAMVLFTLCLPPAMYAQKLVYVVRHAERADGGMMQPQADPPLSARGEARAAKLAAMLGEAGISAVYATEFRRTKDTARPLAEKLHLTVKQYPSEDANALIKMMRAVPAGDIVLVVGHSNTVPAIIKALGCPEIKIADDDYDNLFVVVPATGTTSRLRFTP